MGYSEAEILKMADRAIVGVTDYLTLTMMNLLNADLKGEQRSRAERWLRGVIKGHIKGAVWGAYENNNYHSYYKWQK